MKNVWSVFAAIVVAALAVGCAANKVVVESETVIDPGLVIKPQPVYRSSNPGDAPGTYDAPGFLEAPVLATESVSAVSMDIIPDAKNLPKEDGNRLSYTVRDVWAENKYWTVTVSGIRKKDQTVYPGDDTTYVNGVLYGDFRLELFDGEMCVSSLKINVPRDDRFLVLESTAVGLSYGCTVLSNKKEFGADNYPDIIQLDFYLQGELEVPQYARYFAVHDGELCEIPVFSGGTEVSPYGTHPLMKSAGYMVQYLTVSEWESPGDYTIVKYEYYFDAENMCLNRNRASFYGWEYE